MFPPLFFIEHNICTIRCCEWCIMREWLSGRASPCQGERREFESRLPLQCLKAPKIRDFFFFNTITKEIPYKIIIRHHSQVVRQRSATPLSPVQVWVAPPKIDKIRQSLVDFTYYLFTLHYSLKILVDFWKVISNSE